MLSDELEDWGVRRSPFEPTTPLARRNAKRMSSGVACPPDPPEPLLARDCARGLAGRSGTAKKLLGSKDMLTSYCGSDEKTCVPMNRVYFLQGGGGGGAERRRGGGERKRKGGRKDQWAFSKNEESRGEVCLDGAVA